MKNMAKYTHSSLVQIVYRHTMEHTKLVIFNTVPNSSVYLFYHSLDTNFLFQKVLLSYDICNLDKSLIEALNTVQCF